MEKMMKNIRILLPIIILCTGLFAVINTFEDSYTRINNINIPFKSITMPEVDVDALIRNMGETAVELSEIYLHLVEVNQIHVIEAEEVFGVDLPYEIEVQKQLDIYMNFVTDRPLMEDLETEGWVVCHAEGQDFPSNKIECTL